MYALHLAKFHRALFAVSYAWPLTDSLLDAQPEHESLGPEKLCGEGFKWVVKMGGPKPQRPLIRLTTHLTLLQRSLLQGCSSREERKA